MDRKKPSEWHLAWRIIALEHKVFTQKLELRWVKSRRGAEHRTPVVRNLGISPRTGVDVVVTCQIPGQAHIIDGPFQTRVPYGVYLDEMSLERALEILRDSGQRSADGNGKSLNWWAFDRIWDMGRESHPLGNPVVDRTPSRAHPARDRQRTNRLADFWKARRNDTE